MPRHQDKDAAFDTPADWVDRTIVAYSAPADDTGREAAPNFVMTREPMRDADSLRGHADRQLLELGRHLKGFDLLESKETTLGGAPAIYMHYTWMGHAGRLDQSVTIVERPAPYRAETRVAVSFTTTSKAEDAEKMKPVFAEMLKTVRFDQAPPSDGGPPPPTSRPLPSSALPPTDAPLVPMPGYRGGRR
jgi:hypothetical protein